MWSLVACFSGYSQVNIYPGADIQAEIDANPSGTSFVINPGTYRITTPLKPLDNDKFIGATTCNTNPTVSPESCAAVISGSVSIGSAATFDGTYYKVTGQTEQGLTWPTADCISGYPGCIYPEDLFFDGVPLLHLNSAKLPAIATGQWWFDYTNHVIYFHDNPSGHLVEVSVAPAAFQEGGSSVTLQYLTLEEFAVPVPSSGGIWPWSGGASDAYRQAHGLNWIIENCELWGFHGPTINPNYGMQILNNYIHNNGMCGVCGWGTTSNGASSGILVQGNNIAANNSGNWANFNPGYQAGGIKFGNIYTPTIRGNLIKGNEGAGIHFDVDSFGALVDGNTISGNADGDGIVAEISGGSGYSYIFRNNILTANGTPGVAKEYPSFQIHSLASIGVNAYCNLVDSSNVNGEQAWGVEATNRTYRSGGHANSTGNSVHHNTVIWAGSGNQASVGYSNLDSENQPNFLANNTPPDYNAYHLASSESTNFIYDNGGGTRSTFATYQANGGDSHGMVDNIYTNGYPSVLLTSPPDQSLVGPSVTISANASDTSGISKVEFYVDWELKAIVANSPYNFDWSDGTAGSHIVAAMAYGNSGIARCYAETLTVGAGSPALSLTPSNVSFGTENVRTTSGTRNITLGNSGTAALSITTVTISGSNASDFSETNNCGSTLPAGTSCAVSIAFTPIAAGARSASLVISDSATGSPQSAALSGTGVAVPEAVLDPSSLTFDNQMIATTSAPQSVTLSNSGTAPLSIATITITGNNASDFTETNNCGSSLSPESSCRVSVTFTPRALGARSASLVISDNATSSPQSAALSGTGVALP